MLAIRFLNKRPTPLVNPSNKRRRRPRSALGTPIFYYSDSPTPEKSWGFGNWGGTVELVGGG